MSDQTETNTEISNATTVAVQPVSQPVSQQEAAGSTETILPGGKDQVSHQTVELSQQSIKTEAILTAASIVDEANRTIEATIIKPGLAKVITCDGKPVTYTEEALYNSVPLWESATCFVDHWNKSVRNIAGVFFSPWYDQGVKAKLRFLDETLYNMVARIVQDRQAGLPVPDVGLSADIMVNGTSSETAFTVNQVTGVISADIVFSPAAGGSFDRVLNSVMQDLGIPDKAAVHTPTPDLAAPPLANAAVQADGELVPIKRVRDLQSATDRLRNQVKDQESTITRLQANLDQAVARYRDATLATHPEIHADLVKGATVAEVDASLINAQAVVDQVKQHLMDRVPAGAPVRKGPDMASMSPKDLIAYGLKQRQAGKQ
ncbi:MAG: hypothetical protein V1724_04400 [Chloroflexota bacterium]